MTLDEMLAEIDREIDKLMQVRGLLADSTEAPKGGKRGRPMSDATKEKIKAAHLKYREAKRDKAMGF